MDFNEFSRYFSSARVNRYFVATGHHSQHAIELYKANLNVSQAFHPLLGVLEVVLRNRINDILSVHFKDPDWIINQKTGFMVDPSLVYYFKKTGKLKKNDFLLIEIQNAEKRLCKSGTTITSGKIIAEQSLGFWTDFYAVYNYKLLKGEPIHVFTTLPPGHGRKEVKDELDRIRRFRNRINHNEPICFSGTAIDFTNALDVHQSILKILGWIDFALVLLIKDLDTVKKNIDTAYKI